MSVIRRGAIGVASALLLLGTTAMGGPHTPPSSSREAVGLATVHISPAPLAASMAISPAEDANAFLTAPQIVIDKPSLSPMAKEATPPDAGPKLLPLPAWVQAVKEAVLWTRSDTQAEMKAKLPGSTVLKVIGQAEMGRLPVYFDDGAPNGQKFGAWVELGDVEPSDSPDRVAVSSRGGSRPTPDISTPDKFIAAVAVAAQASQKDSGVPASVTIAQAILESDWGKSQLSKKANNFFGIKSISGPGPAGVIAMDTWEVLNGKDVTVKDGFKAYHNMDESILDHGRFLRDNKRYTPAFQVPNDPQEFAKRIHAAGYATDPGYSTKLVNLMNRLNLYQYDLRS